jgi:hypothetical protein
MVEFSGWYGPSDLNWQSLVDFVVLAAMSSPGATPQTVSPRLLRHMHVVGVTDQDDTALVRIFTIILQTHMKRGNFSTEASGLARPVRFCSHACLRPDCVGTALSPRPPPSCRRWCDWIVHASSIARKQSMALCGFDPFSSFPCPWQLVMATLQLYQRCLRDLKPTPAKSHYLFNVRDFFRVVSGVMLLPASRVGTHLGKLVRGCSCATRLLPVGMWGCGRRA